MTLKFIVNLIIFPLLILLFLLAYFKDTPDSVGVTIAFFVMFLFPAILIFVLSIIPSISKKSFHRGYYKSMKWDADTINEYERDLKSQEDAAKAWTKEK